jgi:cysteine-rich repeat protein
VKNNKTLWIFAIVMPLAFGSCDSKKHEATATKPSEDIRFIVNEGFGASPGVGEPIIVRDELGPTPPFGDPPLLPPVEPVPVPGPEPGPVVDPELELGDEIPGDPTYLTNPCGNGIRNFNEQCDDGNDNNLDTCNTVCGRPSCGNAVLEIHEECDDGNNLNGDGCSARCLYERCGNERIDTIGGIKEECDDGNLKAGDGCSRACTIERCGNRILDPGEQCDLGPANRDAGPCTTCCIFNPACPVETEE